MIIREGEKITPDDLDKLDAFYKGQEGNKFINISIFSGIFLTIVLLSVIFTVWPAYDSAWEKL